MKLVLPHARQAVLIFAVTSSLLCASSVIADDTILNNRSGDENSQIQSTDALREGKAFDLKGDKESTNIQLAQSTRRRPGAKAGKRRQREDADSDLIRGATTPAAAEKKTEIYKRLEVAPPPPTSEEFIDVPNRWTMLYEGKWWDPYNQNILKGDLKMWGDDGKPWFLELTAMSDTLIEQRGIPTPVGLATTQDSGRDNVFGDYDQTFVNENILLQASIIRGNTVFRPQDFEIRIGALFNFNYAKVGEIGALRADPVRGDERGDNAFTFIEAFIDYHLADISKRYDFVSTRVGIQRFNADFRGFVYSDEQPGFRLFGNVDENKWQWNLAWFRRLEKDVNAGINKLFEDRKEDVLIANLYRQDAFVLGHDIQLIGIHRDDRFGDEGANFDENGFLTSPAPFGDERFKNVRTTYLGFNTNGHIGRLNITSALYYAFGSESHNPIASQRTDINAYMGAVELSVDIDWIRPRFSTFYASGDDDPFDDEAGGFDAIFDNPNFMGGDNTFWQRQGIPLIAGGGINLVNRLSLLPNLRAGKEQGQSNYVNPGILMVGLGLDLDVTPKLLWFNNVNYLQFDDTSSLEAVRQDGSIDEKIGIDISSAFLYRPFLNNNVQWRFGASALLPDKGFENLYNDDETVYSIFTNFIFLY
jgi:hypothetical protein